MRLIERVLGWLAQERGQTLVEYGMVILLVAIAAVAALGSFSTALNDFYDTATAAIP